MPGFRRHLWNPEITGVKALGKQRVVSLPGAVSIVVAVNGKFLSLPTINLTTLPLACSDAAPGAKGRVWAGWSA